MITAPDNSSEINPTLRNAVRLALATSAVGAFVPAGVAMAADATAAATTNNADSELTEVVITGSHVRRVDSETASPVLVMDAATISQTGAETVGDLIDRIPSIAGAATNPNINNGGGFGESNIELRGLGATRTLILIDGKRVNLLGASDAVDVNQIPLNLIERVDVLKEGAGAIYGSDAVGGVVNFVTRKKVDGVELTGDWGESSHHDAQHYNLGLLAGASSDKFSFVAGVNYQKQKELTMGQRAWSKQALYLYSGVFSPGGSSRVPTGNISLPNTPINGGPSLVQIYGGPNCKKSVTLNAVGLDPTNPANYHCYSGADAFNYQPYNLNATPQERAALFTKLNYEINEHANVYASVIYNHTHSGFQIAPLPFDAINDNVVISAQSYYNPFGIDFGGASGANPQFKLRLSALGDRRSDTTSASMIDTLGVKGELGLGDWSYDLNGSVNRLDQNALVTGYFSAAALGAALGPSFLDPASGVVTCGTAAAPISNCTPINIFNLYAPGQAAALASIAQDYTTNLTTRANLLNLDFNGTVFELPAGKAQGALGFSYQTMDQVFTRSSSTLLQAPDYLNCSISQEACGSNYQGSYNVKEVYGELYVPILANVPGAKALDVDIGVRYSDYSNFGSTTRSMIKVEYRPVSDVLFRGTYAQIFRAPTISDLFGGRGITSTQLQDVCNGYTGPTSTYPNLAAACQGIVAGSGFSPNSAQVTGVTLGNPSLKPETGDVETFGFVFDPSFARGLSLSADWWSYKLDNVINNLDPNYAEQECATGQVTAFCSLIDRYLSGPNAGQVIEFLQPTYNLGELKTRGIDFNVTYKMPRTPVGTFGIVADVTRLISYTNTPAPGATEVQIAGTYNKEFGFYAKNRGTVSLTWAGFDANAMLTARYIGGVSMPDANPTNGVPAGYAMPAVTYYDLSVGYKFGKTGTSLRAGILNLGDKTPPIAGVNSYGSFDGSSNTSVTTYDTIGRRYFIGFTQKF